MKRSTGVLMLVFFVVSFVYAHQKHFDRASAASRLDLLYAVVLDRTLKIDKYHMNTPDTAEWQGHFYSDKAPGTVALALPVFGAATALMTSFGESRVTKVGWLSS